MVIAKVDTLELRLLEEGDVRHVAAMEPGDLTYSQGEWICAPGQHTSYVADKAARNRDGASVFCGIWMDGQLVGLAGLQAIDRQIGTASLDYVVDARFRRQGIATRACRALIEYGFRELGLDRIRIEVDVANVPSCRVAERFGLAQDGIIRNRYEGRDGPRDCAVYVVSGDEWHDHL